MMPKTSHETQRRIYVAVFDDRGDAELAARALREQGFTDDRIGYAWRGETGTRRQEGTKAAKMAAAGGGSGVVLGGVIGAGAALLIPGVGPVVSGGLLASALASAATGAITGAVVGGVSGALVGLGIPEHEAKFYDDRFNEGRTLLTVRADDRYDDAADLLRSRGGYDYLTRGDRTFDETERESEIRR
jgi:hypothetical protein